MKNQLLKISRLKIAIIVRLWPVAMVAVGSLQRDFYLQKGGLMPERTARLLKLALEGQPGPQITHPYKEAIMTEIPISQEAGTNQENDEAIDVQTLPKRPERPPVYLMCEGEVVENPDASLIVTELDFAVFAPIRVAYELIDKYNEDGWIPTKGMEAIANTLFMALEKWDFYSRYL